MIALADTISTGLLLSSGQAIATEGPLGAFLQLLASPSRALFLESEK